MRSSRMLMAVALAAAAFGCSRAPSYDFAHLAGKVTVNGEPVNEGQIVFMPAAMTRGPAVGGKFKAGRYDCPRVPRGEVVVQIHALRSTGKTEVVMGKTIQVMENITPTDAKKGQKLQVAADNLQQDFALTSTAKK